MQPELGQTNGSTSLKRVINNHPKAEQGFTGATKDSNGPDQTVRMSQDRCSHDTVN